MKILHFKIVLLFLICINFSFDVSAAKLEPYKILVAEKNGKISFFIPTMHASNELMRKRLDKTLACLPEIGSIAIEMNSEQKNFSLLKFGIEANSQSKLVIPMDLLKKLDEISNTAMPPPRHLPDQASTFNELGIHPGIVLFLLDQPIRNYVALKNSWDIFGPSFESLLTQFSTKKKVPMVFLESPQMAFTSFLKITHSSIVAQLVYLVELQNDKVKQNAMLNAMDKWAIPLQYEDWTKSNLDSRSNAIQAGYVENYVDEVVVNRTKSMIDFFDSLPKESRPMLVAIGFGHYGGGDGVEKQLALRGYVITEKKFDCNAD